MFTNKRDSNINTKWRVISKRKNKEKMIKPEELFNLFKINNLTFYTGVPDSLLKDFCAYITDNTEPKDNIIAANEGNAIALATGYHLSTKNVGIVYMQNSGLGNCVNPLTSLTDKEVYSIPMLLIIGWRGEPGKKDEPQHIKQGEITLGLLNVLGIHYKILPEDIEKAKIEVEKAIGHIKKNNEPYALMVRKGTFEPYELQNKKPTNYPLNREEAIKLVTPLLEDSDIIVSTTGKTSRELFELRKNNNQSHQRDFLTVGCMGHSGSIALGIALQKPNRQVFCFDGDGSLIMHMGSLSSIGKLQPNNFKHIVFNNFAHDSVGGQPTAADAISISGIARENGYKSVLKAETTEEIKQAVNQLKATIGPALLEIKINKGARKDLGRPTRTPLQNKADFMNFLQ